VYFFAKGNLLVEMFGKTNFKSPKEVVKLGVDLTIMNVLEVIVYSIMHGMIPDEDDEESVAGFLAAQTAQSFAASFPIIREASSVIEGFSSGSALANFQDVVGKALVQLGQGEVDMALFRSLNKLGGLVLKYPAGAMNRLITAGVEQYQGEDVSPIEYLLWQED
jgi:hypothetical protein